MPLVCDWSISVQLVLKKVQENVSCNHSAKSVIMTRNLSNWIISNQIIVNYMVSGTI